MTSGRGVAVELEDDPNEAAKGFCGRTDADIEDMIEEVERMLAILNDLIVTGCDASKRPVRTYTA